MRYLQISNKKIWAVDLNFLKLNQDSNFILFNKLEMCLNSVIFKLIAIKFYYFLMESLGFINEILGTN